MSKTRTIHSTLFRSALGGLAIGMVLAAAPAAAGRHTGHHGGHHHAGHHTGHHGGHHHAGRHVGHHHAGHHHGGHHSRHYAGYYIYSYGHHGYRYYPSYGYSTTWPPTYTRPPHATVEPYTPPLPGGGVAAGSHPEPPDATYDASTSRGLATPPATGVADMGTFRNRRADPAGDGGWVLLADGRYAHALRTFANDAMSQPTKAAPKVGYALAAAALGDLSRGVWAMRRALRIDPDSVHYVTVDGPLRPRVQHLVDQYQQILDRSGHNRETAFMLASLHYLLRHTASARASMALVRQEGDSTSSAANLGRLIDELPRLDAGRRARAPAR